EKERSRKVIPVAILPGFPTSAIFTFHEFIAPVIRKLAGRVQPPADTIRARLPLRVNAERGRTEYLLVNLVSEVRDTANRQPTDSETQDFTTSPPLTTHHSPLTTHHPSYTAYPMGKGSGSVTTFSRADGFVVIPRQREYLEAEETVEV